MSDAVSSRVLEAAIAWQLSLDGGQRSPAEQVEFEHWYAASDEHARAWGQLGMLDQRFSAASGPARQALVHSRDILRRRLRGLGGVAAVLLAVGLALSLGHQRLPFDYWLAEQRTATGERRLLQLADGTRINLDTHSAIDIRYDAKRRLIVLREGEILVETGHAHADPRPLYVETRDGRAQALGTRFLVRREAEGTRLGVLKSAVVAQPQGSSERQTLHEGEQLLMSRDGLEAIAALPPGADSWTRGMLVVDDARLDQLIAELGRYRPGRLAVSPEVAGLRITGSFPLYDSDLALSALLPTLPVQIDQHTRWWTTINPRQNVSR
jgi:transmembrane sensor